MMPIDMTPSPSDKLVLLDGRELTAYPRQRTEPSVIDSMNLPLDDILQNEQEQQRRFIENAFFLYAHREQILSDSRMFLCPIAIKNGLAYTGTSGFRGATLGVYLEWWTHCKGALRTGDDGVRSLIYKLAGSPLSGVNRCAAIREDGTSECITLRPFSDYWRPFMHINQRYSEVQNLYEAYTLEQVLDTMRGGSQ